MHACRTLRARATTLVAATLLATVVPPALSASAEDAGPVPAPSTISSVSPRTGLVSGAEVVVVSGGDFTGTTAVSFSGTPATRFTVTSPTLLTVVTPRLPAGTHAVSVTTAAGSATGGEYTVRTLESEVLRLVNQARGSRRTCGSTAHRAVPALRADAKLARVAAAHSADMAKRNYFNHKSRNGDTPFDRMRAAGYAYSSAGENIAAGYRSPASVVKAWLKSPGHCRNIMRKSFTELGVGYATGGLYGSYWTQDFGRPR